MTTGRRVYLRRYRVHHGFVGCVLVGCGGALIWHDRADWQSWWPSKDRN